MPTKQSLLISGNFDLQSSVENRLSQLFTIKHLKFVPDVQILAEAIGDVQFYIVGGSEYVDASLLDSAHSLRAIVVMGTGTGSFLDEEAARKRGIEVRNTPGINAETVAEFALGMIIALNSGAFRSAEGVASGAQWDQPLRLALDDASVGLLGMGMIGSALASRIRSIAPGCRILYWSRTRRHEIERNFGVVWSDKEEIFRSADICSIQMAYHPQATHHVVGADLLRLGRGRLKLLNMANPRLVDPIALRAALVSGDLAYAAIDGYYNEWTANRGRSADEYGLLDLVPSKFIATSHVAALSTRAINGAMESACNQLEEITKA